MRDSTRGDDATDTQTADDTGGLSDATSDSTSHDDSSTIDSPTTDSSTTDSPTADSSTTDSPTTDSPTTGSSRNTRPSESNRGAREPDYEIRFFEDGDREGFLDLYRSVMGPATDAWFEWKYESSPYVSHVPIVVAVTTDTNEVVAARPQVPFRMTVGRDRHLALRFGDTVVAEPHRRRGLFTRTTQRALAHYAGERPRFAFNFPNQLSEPGYRRMGGELVQELPTAYRVQDTDALAASRASGVTAPLLEVGTELLSVARAATGDVSHDEFGGRTIRYERLEPARLAAIARECRAERVHATRDETFYAWRFENPRWTYAVYYAERDGEDVAALVTGTANTDRGTVTNVLEPIPLDATVRSTAATRALLATVVADSRDADVLAYAGTAIDHGVLREFGFRADDEWPLSSVASPTRHVAYDLADAGESAWVVDGLDLRRPESWALTFSEHDSR